MTRSGRVLVLKHHVERAPFLREVFALRLWQGLPEVPRLVAAPDYAGRTFLIEHLPEPVDLDQRKNLVGAAQSLGTLHAVAALKLGRREPTAAPSSAGVASSGATERRDPTGEVLLREDLRGAGTRVTIGDRKHEHFRWRAGAIVTIDFESVLVGGLPLRDLVELVYGGHEVGTDLPFAEVATAYCQGRGAATKQRYPAQRLAGWLAEQIPS